MVEGPTEEVLEEVKRELKEMKSGKALCPTGMASDLMKGAGNTGELTRLFSEIVDKGKYPKNEKIVTVPIRKRKGNV